MFLGTHELIEYHNCDTEILKDSNKIKEILMSSDSLGNATIVNSMFHSFSPFGVTGVLVISESHISIHTWHEYRYCAVDIFSCCDKLDNEIIKENLSTELRSSNFESRLINRGNTLN